MYSFIKTIVELQVGSGGTVPIPFFVPNPIPNPTGSGSRTLLQRDRERDRDQLYGTGSGRDQLFRDGFNYFILQYSESEEIYVIMMNKKREFIDPTNITHVEEKSISIYVILTLSYNMIL